MLPSLQFNAFWNRFSSDEDILTQLELFETERNHDNSQLVTPEGIDLSNTVHVFRFVNSQVGLLLKSHCNTLMQLII